LVRRQTQVTSIAQNIREQDAQVCRVAEVLKELQIRLQTQRAKLQDKQRVDNTTRPAWLVQSTEADRQREEAKLQTLLTAIADTQRVYDEHLSRAEQLSQLLSRAKTGLRRVEKHRERWSSEERRQADLASEEELEDLHRARRFGIE